MAALVASGAGAQEAAGTSAPPTAGARAGTVRISFAEALRRAADQHPLIEGARARVSAARGRRMTAGTLPNPVLTYWAENLGGSGEALPAPRETQTFATLPVEPLFQRSPRVRGADAEVRAATAVMARTRQLVILDAARAFHRLAAAQIAVEATEEIRARLTELVTFNRARVREGVAAEADLIRAQVELDRVSASAALARVERARARAELLPYLGRRTAGQLRLPSADSLFVTLEDSLPRITLSELGALGDLVTAARNARPDIAAARERASAARAEVSTQRALTVRQIGLTVGTKQTLGGRSLLAGASLPLPLFDQNRGEVQRATGEHSAAEQELIWTERRAIADVEAAYESARILTGQVEEFRGSFLARAADSRRIALAAYQEGAVSLLQVLDASRTFVEATLTYYQTLFAQRQSVLELQAAVGATRLDGLPPFVPPSAAMPSPLSPEQ